ncbi:MULTISPECIES: hypothetical protein [Cysteiniphilum]|uniref:hypothetical protein n=1 Tax=Cysteiniphilum TaxID=2056696 RepID=UPI0019399C1D|nr:MULTISPECIES: hypothetical protein [Cysteiniphilum]
MILSFLIDQVQQAVCQYYQRARKRYTALSALHLKIRILVDIFYWESWIDIYQFIANPAEHPPPILKV